MAINSLRIKEIPHIQDLAYCMGQEGCLFIVLCAIAEQISNMRIDLLRMAHIAIEHGYLDYIYKEPRNHLREAFYVRDRDNLLALLTGKKGITTRKVKALPRNYKGYYYIQYRNGNYTHFVLPDYNSMYYSATVAKGELEYYVLVNVPEEVPCG